MPRTHLTLSQAAAALMTIALCAPCAAAPARDIGVARLQQIDELTREFQQTPRQPSGAYNAPPQPSGYTAPAETSVPPSDAQGPGWIATRPVYPIYRGIVHPVCTLPHRFHPRIALWRPPHAFDPRTLTCSVRPRWHRH